MASKPVLLFFSILTIIRAKIYYYHRDSEWNNFAPTTFRITISIMDLASIRRRRIFIYFARQCGPGGTRPIRKPGGPPAEEEEESVEIGGKRRGKWRREEKMLPSLLNYWTVHSGSFAYSNIYTDSILPPVLLSPSGLPRQVGWGEGRLRARGRVVARIPRCKLFHDSFRGGSRLEFA